MLLKPTKCCFNYCIWGTELASQPLVVFVGQLVPHREEATVSNARLQKPSSPDYNMINPDVLCEILTEKYRFRRYKPEEQGLFRSEPAFSDWSEICRIHTDTQERRTSAFSLTEYVFTRWGWDEGPLCGPVRLTAAVQGTVWFRLPVVGARPHRSSAVNTSHSVL